MTGIRHLSVGVVIAARWLEMRIGISADEHPTCR
jgi:hypothetical protein